MNRRYWVWGLLLLLALPIGSCGSSGEPCDRCSTDSECTGGLVCSSFSDGSKRCGSGTGDTNCRVR